MRNAMVQVLKHYLPHIKKNLLKMKSLYKFLKSLFEANQWQTKSVVVIRMFVTFNRIRFHQKPIFHNFRFFYLKSYFTCCLVFHPKGQFLMSRHIFVFQLLDCNIKTNCVRFLFLVWFSTILLIFNKLKSYTCSPAC